MKYFNQFIGVLFAIVLLTSCNSNPLNVDVSNITVPSVKIERLEKDMFTMNPDSVNKYTPILLKKYGRFYVDFVTGFLNDGGLVDSTYAYALKRFITDKDMRGTYDTCEKTFANMNDLEQGLTGAFKHFKYYFPNMPLPRVVTEMSGYNYAIIYYDSTLAISLEMYLGEHCPFYQMLQFPRYKIMHMNKTYLLSDVVYAWLASIFPPNEDNHDMLALIVHQGKIMYLTDAMLPQLDDTIKLRYSSKQLNWCKENEFNMWAYLVQKKFLYSTNLNDITNFTDDGPFTKAFNKDFSPSRTGSWLGLQIIRSYVKKNSSITLQELMDKKSADEILARSGYKPAK